MRILIFGGTGMLGHQLSRSLSSRFSVTATVRCAPEVIAHELPHVEVIGSVTAEDLDSVAGAIADSRPALVINCIGLVKQLRAGREALPNLLMNSVFPHRLAALCKLSGAHFIHISTDCVFAGTRGGYREEDTTDADDLYGRSKSLGEVTGKGCLTIRTSLIGHELGSRHGLLEWFLSKSGVISGYTNAVFSGVTTLAFAEMLGTVIGRGPLLDGLWHFSSTPISKFDLLCLIRNEYGLDITIRPDDSVVYDRSLNSDRFRKATGLSVPAWPEMIRRMHQDHGAVLTVEAGC